MKTERPDAASTSPTPLPPTDGSGALDETIMEAPAERGASRERVADPAGDPTPGEPEVQPDITALEGSLTGAIEAICMVVDDPVEAVVLAQVLGQPVHEVTAALEQLASEYAEAGRGFELREVQGGWRFYSRPVYAAAVERFVLDGQQARLTQAALETLAVVAYRQPVSRGRVSAVRGVNVDGVMRTLLARGLVDEAGMEEGSGAILYRTSSYFLERLGLRDLTELPELAPLLPDVELMDGPDG